MIKDIIDKFVISKQQIRKRRSRSRREPETVPSFGDTPQLQSADVPPSAITGADDSNRSIVSANPSQIASTSDKMVTLSRKKLISLLSRSDIKDVKVPLDLLELLDWERPLLAAPKAVKSRPIPYERKFGKASIFIEPIDDDDESEDEESMDDVVHPNPSHMVTHSPETASITTSQQNGPTQVTPRNTVEKPTGVIPTMKPFVKSHTQVDSKNIAENVSPSEVFKPSQSSDNSEGGTSVIAKKRSASDQSKTKPKKRIRTASDPDDVINVETKLVELTEHNVETSDLNQGDAGVIDEASKHDQGETLILKQTLLQQYEEIKEIDSPVRCKNVSSPSLDLSTRTQLEDEAEPISRINSFSENDRNLVASFELMGPDRLFKVFDTDPFHSHSLPCDSDDTGLTKHVSLHSREDNTTGISHLNERWVECNLSDNGSEFTNLDADPHTSQASPVDIEVKQAETKLPTPLVEKISESASAQGNASTNATNNKKKNSRLLRQLSTNLNPGILSVCHKPKVFAPPSHFKPSEGREYANLLVELLHIDMPEHASEIPFRGSHSKALAQRFPSCIVDPTRVDKCYYKTHLSSEFVNNFASFMPECVRIKRTVSKKGISFISTIAATLSHTHYDQDTSFLLLLTGTKEVFYAPPCMVDRLRVDHPVLSHSSIFEDVNPFVAAKGTLWEFVTLNAGDGLLLPQGWVHAIKSVPGTVAISFQVESSGIDATSPYVRRGRNTDPEDLRHLSSIALDIEEVDDTIERKSHGTTPVTKDSVAVVCDSVSGSSTKSSSDNRGQSDKIASMEENKIEFPRKNLAVVNKNTNATKERRVMARATIQTHSRYGRTRPTMDRANIDVVPDEVVSTVLPTRKLVKEQISVRQSVRRSKREKFICGVDGCNRTFPVDDGMMWVLVLSLDAENTSLQEKDLPAVPTNHPKHLVCVECRPLKGFAFFSPVEVLTEKDKREINGWENYCYYAASRADYEKWATHRGENGKIHSSFVDT